MNAIQLTSRFNPQLEVSVFQGHFATRHSHNSHYIDITRMKHEFTMAREAAMTLAQNYAYDKGVDTIVCLDGSEVIGAFLARHLAKKEVFSVNSNKNINVVTPEYDSNGQLIFRDNLTPMIVGREVLILISTVNSGKSAGAPWSVSSITAARSRALPPSSACWNRWTASRCTVFSPLTTSPDISPAPPRSAPCAGPARRSMPWPTVSACPCCDPRLLSCIPRMHDFYTYLFIFLCIIFIFGESKRNIFCRFWIIIRFSTCFLL